MWPASRLAPTNIKAPNPKWCASRHAAWFPRREEEAAPRRVPAQRLRASGSSCRDVGREGPLTSGLTGEGFLIPGRALQQELIGMKETVPSQVTGEDGLGFGTQ